MPFVYRIETANGGGLYRSELGSLAELLGLHEDWDANAGDWFRFYEEHPTPSQDAKLNWNELPYSEQEQYHFGVSSLKLVKMWVFRKKYRQKLASLGFRINKYYVPKEFCRVGDCQTIFIKDKAVFIQERELDYDDN